MGFEIFLKISCFGCIIERNSDTNLPRNILGGVRHITRVVTTKPLLKVRGHAGVVPPGIRNTFFPTRLAVGFAKAEH